MATLFNFYLRQRDIWEGEQVFGHREFIEIADLGQLVDTLLLLNLLPLQKLLGIFNLKCQISYLAEKILDQIIHAASTFIVTSYINYRIAGF